MLILLCGAALNISLLIIVLGEMHGIVGKPGAHMYQNIPLMTFIWNLYNSQYTSNSAVNSIWSNNCV